METAIPKLMTVAEAAAELDVAPQTIYDWLEEDPPRLERAATPGQVLVTAESVQACDGKRPGGRKARGDD